MEYRVVIGLSNAMRRDIEELNTQVTALISDGWEPYGHPFQYGNASVAVSSGLLEASTARTAFCICQAMIKKG